MFHPSEDAALAFPALWPFIPRVALQPDDVRVRKPNPLPKGTERSENSWVRAWWNRVETLTSSTGKKENFVLQELGGHGPSC